MELNNTKKYSFFLKGKNQRAVLLIHGITGSPSEMHYLGKALNKAGYTVLCNTLPRHCSSLGELKKVTWREIAAACIDDFKNLKADNLKVFVGGLSMGAILAVHIAFNFPEDIAGLIALAPTIFYDGWALHKGRIFLHLAWHIPFLRNKINIREAWPYGLKDESIRLNIERFYKNAKASEFDSKVLLFGSPFFPLASLYQHSRFTRVVVGELKAVKNPTIILHARDDDMVSVKNAQYLFKNIAAVDKELIILEDSYHMITIDKEKDKVAREVIRFLNNH